MIANLRSQISDLLDLNARNTVTPQYRNTEVPR